MKGKIHTKLATEQSSDEGSPQVHKVDIYLDDTLAARARIHVWGVATVAAATQLENEVARIVAGIKVAIASPEPKPPGEPQP